MFRLSWKSAPNFAVVMVIFLTAMCASTPAWAHALLRNSTPAANSVIPAGDVAFILKYNSRVDPAHSSLSLLEPGGKVVPLSIGRQTAGEVLSSRANLSAKGSYELRWQALSSDGHITRGEVPFRVR